MGWQRRLSPLTESTFGRSYLRTVGGDLGEKIHRLGVASALLDQARHGIAALAPALVAGDLDDLINEWMGLGKRTPEASQP